MCIQEISPLSPFCQILLSLWYVCLILSRQMCVEQVLRRLRLTRLRTLRQKCVGANSNSTTRIRWRGYADCLLQWWDKGYFPEARHYMRQVFRPRCKVSEGCMESGLEGKEWRTCLLLLKTPRNTQEAPVNGLPKDDFQSSVNGKWCSRRASPGFESYSRLSKVPSALGAPILAWCPPWQA